MAVLATRLLNTLAKIDHQTINPYEAHDPTIGVDAVIRMYDVNTDSIRITIPANCAWGSAYIDMYFDGLPLTPGANYVAKAVTMGVGGSVGATELVVKSSRGTLYNGTGLTSGATQTTLSGQFTAAIEEQTRVTISVGQTGGGNAGGRAINVMGVWLEEAGTNASFYVDVSEDASNYVILDNGLKCYHVDVHLGTVYPKGVYMGWGNVPTAKHPEGTLFGHPEWGSRVAFLKNGEWAGTIVGYTTEDPGTGLITLHEWPAGAWEEVVAYERGVAPYTFPIVYKTGGITGSHFYSLKNNKVYDYEAQGTQGYTTVERTAPTGVTEDPTNPISGELFSQFGEGDDSIFPTAPAPEASAAPGPSAPVQDQNSNTIPTGYVLLAVAAALISGVIS